MMYWFCPVFSRGLRRYRFEVNSSTLIVPMEVDNRFFSWSVLNLDV